MNDSDLLPPSVDPNIKKIGVRRLTAHNDASARTLITVRDFEVVTDEVDGGNTGPTPLETTLASLAGCEGVIIYRCAEAMRFSYSAVDIEAEGEVDARGSRGVRGVRPYFLSVRIDIRIKTNEPENRLEQLRRNVENRCPVMNLFRDAGVEVTAQWTAVND